MISFGSKYGGCIKSVQRGVTSSLGASGEIEVAIAAVNPAKTFVNLLSNYSAANPSTVEAFSSSVRLVSATKLGVTAVSVQNGAYTGRGSVSWEVIEWY